VTARPSGGPAPDPPHVRHDAERLADLGAIARYDRSIPVADRVLEEFGAAVAAPAWAVPLGARGITQYMPMTGGRPDIGPTTLSQAAWLISSDRRAAAYAMGQAEAAGSVPWHFWDPGRRWLARHEALADAVDRPAGPRAATGPAHPGADRYGMVPRTSPTSLTCPTCPTC
jgi:hypothetical protein